MAAVIVRNTGDVVITDWRVSWEWLEDQSITNYWNSKITQVGSQVTAKCVDAYCTVQPGEAQAFGFNLSFSAENTAPAAFSLSFPGSGTVEPPIEPPPVIEPPIEPPPVVEQPGQDVCTSVPGPQVEYVLDQDWGSGGMAGIIVRNNGETTLTDWKVSWQWPLEYELSSWWNADITRSAEVISVSCKDDYCNVGPGEAQAFGFVYSSPFGVIAPENIVLTSGGCNTDGTTDPVDPPEPSTPATDTFNYMLGTQTIGPQYGFTDESLLVETAKEIRAMGSNLLKISLSPYSYKDLSAYNSYNYQFTALVKDVPAFKQVLDMDFTYYMLWVEDSGSWMDNLGLSQEESDLQYRKIYELAKHLLTTYDNTGKTFMIGHWEGDWQYVNLNGAYDDSIDTVPDLRTQGLIDWLNIRQKAIEDAKAEIPHTNVEILQYVEVNRVASAMAGKDRITNKVLPFVDVDLVSYSAYDIVNKYVDYADLKQHLTGALDYIEDNLKPKDGVPFDKRVFIGEYGYASYWFLSWGDEAANVQRNLSKNVMKVSLEWGTPFVLYWQMYDNEYDGYAGMFKGFWLINDEGVKQPIYYTHETFYSQAKTWVTEFKAEQGRAPTQAEFRAKALLILDGLD